MFGIGFSELIVIMLVILILFGPDKLPEMAHQLGKFMAILKRNSDALRREFYNSVYTPSEELRSRIDLSAREILSFNENDKESMNCEQKAQVEKKEAEEKNTKQEGEINKENEPSKPN